MNSPVLVGELEDVAGRFLDGASVRLPKVPRVRYRPQDSRKVWCMRVDDTHPLEQFWLRGLTPSLGPCVKVSTYSPIPRHGVHLQLRKKSWSLV